MRDGENGLLADIGDADGFAGAIATLLAANTLRQAVIAGGYDTLMRQFSEAAVCDAYLELFRQKP
jgi:glycosyltransferase involved in cell wall biosynthesis